MFAALFQKRPEPSYPQLPAKDARGQTSRKGVYAIGECAGTPLLKLGLNEGARLADTLAAELTGTAQGSGGLTDVVIIGGGAAGLACAIRAQKRGLSVVVMDVAQRAQTVVAMTKGKHIFAEPLSVDNESDLWLEECSREELLEKWRAQTAHLDVREGVQVTDVVTRGDVLDVVTASGTVNARRVVLAVGKSGNPRKAGARGEAEHAAKVRHRLADPEELRGQKVLVYGGGDVACEAALALVGIASSVTMASIDTALTFPKKRNRDAVEAAHREGRLALHLGTKLTAIDAGGATLAPATRVECDVVLEMIGADPPLAFFKKLRLAIDGAWSPKKWVAATLVFLAVYSLYAIKKYPEEPFAWPFTRLIDPQAYADVVHAMFGLAFAPFSWLLTDAARADVDQTLWFQQGYLYSLAYTIVMCAFGWQALLRWRSIAKDRRYQTWRYATLIAFQVAFFLLVNVVAVQALSVQHSWRAWGLYQPWPLFFHTFNWWSASDPRAVLALFVGGGLLGTFVIIPLLARRHGKRFCTWVCGCGGLAETLGDRWRHLAPKGSRSRAWEFQGYVVLLAALVVTAVTVGMYQTRADNAWALAYAYLVDFWLVAVVPIALYPFFGGKVWCRYWCPLAAWNQVLAKWYGTLGIESNDKCISCGQCSKQCQVGVDVMQFAKNQERFDNGNSACIHCGICVDVCPVDVLSFGHAPPRARRVGRALPIVS